MQKNPLNKGVLTENFIEIGPVNPDMVKKRARELALIAGRDVTQADYEQARRELTGGTEIDPAQRMLEAIPEEERWNPVPGSIGTQAYKSASEDQDAEGQNESAQLYEEGVKEAEHDQMLQAAKEAEKEDLREL